MLDYQIISAKPLFTKQSDADGTDTVQAYDLLGDSFNRDYILFGRPYVVEEPYIARPDLVSYAMYGNDRYADIICKVNGISNPFELNEGDIIICPFLSYIQAYYDTSQLDSPASLEGYINDEDSIKSSRGTRDFKKLKNEIRTPAEQLIDEENFTIDRTNNIVFY